MPAKASKQGLTAQPNIETKLVSMAHASKEEAYMLNTLTELEQGDIFKNIPLRGDNAGTLLQMSQKPENQTRCPPVLLSQGARAGG